MGRIITNWTITIYVWLEIMLFFLLIAASIIYNYISFVTIRNLLSPARDSRVFWSIEDWPWKDEEASKLGVTHFQSQLFSGEWNCFVRKYVCICLYHVVSISIFPQENRMQGATNGVNQELSTHMIVFYGPWKSNNRLDMMKCLGDDCTNWKWPCSNFTFDFGGHRLVRCFRGRTGNDRNC
jgi:hypothetical protein